MESSPFGKDAWFFLGRGLVPRPLYLRAVLLWAKTPCGGKLKHASGARVDTPAPILVALKNRPPPYGEDLVQRFLSSFVI